MEDKSLRMRQIATRLKQARMDLGMTAEAAADAWGVSRSTQFAYESGGRLPDALYLHEAWAAGMDVNWVVTGAQPQAPKRIETADAELLKMWHLLEPKDRATVAAVIEMALRGKAKN